MKMLKVHTEAEDTDSWRFNNEWVEVELRGKSNPTGWKLQHLIQPSDESQGWQVYYAFEEAQLFAQGTVFRIYSGSMADWRQILPDRQNRFCTEQNERGTFRLNNTGDVLRLVNPEGGEVGRFNLPAPSPALAFHQENVYAYRLRDDVRKSTAEITQQLAFINSQLQLEPSKRILELSTSEIQANQRLFEIQYHVAKGDEAFRQEEYRLALKHYRIAHGLLFSLIKPDWNIISTLDRSVLLPLSEAVFQPILKAGFNLLDAIAKYPRFSNFQAIDVVGNEVVDDKLKSKLELGAYEIDQVPTMAHFHLDQGLKAVERQDYRVAIAQFEQSQEILQQLEPQNTEVKKTLTTALAATLINKGNAYLVLGETQRAKTDLQQALKLYSEVNDELGIAHTNASLGLLPSLLSKNGRASDLILSLAQDIRPHPIKAIRNFFTFLITPLQNLVQFIFQPRKIETPTQSLPEIAFQSLDRERPWVMQEMRLTEAINLQPATKQLKFLVSDQAHIIQWQDGEVPTTQLQQTLYEARVQASDLAQLEWSLDLADRFALTIPHHYYYIIPLSIADTYHALGEYDEATKSLSEKSEGV